MRNKYDDDDNDGYTNYINIENKECKRECDSESEVVNGRNAKKSYYEYTCKTVWLITVLE